MYSKIRAFLRQPFPFSISLIRLLLLCLTTGLFVAVFLLIFKPFGSGDYILEDRTWIIWGYGFVTALILLADMLVLPAVFPKFFDETKWTVSKGIGFQFWHIISIGTANLFYAAFVGGKGIRLLSIPSFLLQALAVGFFPIIFGVFSIQTLLLKRYAESTRRLNDHILASESRTTENGRDSRIVVISSESEKEEIEIRLRDLLFIKSADNYIEIYRSENDQINRILLRSSLKRIEWKLKDLPSLFRCHRAFLVNINNISRVTGNSQGYRLIFKGVEDSIPVSRYTSKDLFKLIARPRSGRNAPQTI